MDDNDDEDEMEKKSENELNNEDSNSSKDVAIKPMRNSEPGYFDCFF